MEAPPAVACGQSFNMACGKTQTLLHMLECLATLSGKKVIPVHQPARKGDVQHTLADISAARAALGYTPRVHFFEEGLEAHFHRRLMRRPRLMKRSRSNSFTS